MQSAFDMDKWPALLLDLGHVETKDRIHAQFVKGLRAIYSDLWCYALCLSLKTMIRKQCDKKNGNTQIPFISLRFESLDSLRMKYATQVDGRVIRTV